MMDLDGVLQGNLELAGSLQDNAELSGTLSVGGINGSGVSSNYNQLINKPQINGVTLTGNKLLSDLGIQPRGDYLDTSKVKNTVSTTAGDVYDVIYINTMIGDIETTLANITTGNGV